MSAGLGSEQSPDFARLFTLVHGSVIQEPMGNYFLGEGCTFVQTEVRAGAGVGGSHVTCHLSVQFNVVQCNAVQSSSIVKVSPAVDWFTKKVKNRRRKSHGNKKKKEKKILHMGDKASLDRC